MLGDKLNTANADLSAMEPYLYDREFYSGQMDGSYRSAAIIVPILLKLLPIKSVCDVGCGAGTWLRVWAEHGIDDLMGFDGAYAADSLQIPRKSFTVVDLNQSLRSDRRFDLAVSVEVAEHLPRSRAESFVRDLTLLSPLVLFGAAIPLQGGTGHINEEWQDQWAVRFAKFGYMPCDVVRPRIWTNPRVEIWYKQNTILYADEATLRKLPELREPLQFPLSVVHPEMFAGSMSLDRKRDLLKLLYWALAKDARNALSRLRLHSYRKKIS